MSLKFHGQSIAMKRCLTTRQCYITSHLLLLRYAKQQDNKGNSLRQLKQSIEVKIYNTCF